MQIIEASIVSVRSAIMRFEPADAGPAFILFPMIHVADAEFYREISEACEECDLILCEGVKSPTGSLITSSYRYFAGSPRLGLVAQREMDISKIRDRMLHADVSGEAFEKKWSQMDTWWRYAIPMAAPLVGLYLRFFGTRELIAERMTMELRRASREIFEDDDMIEFEEVVLHWRDRHLLSVLERERTKSENKDAVIGVLFGAGHMRAVIKHLMRKRGYRQVSAYWATVFKL